MSFFHCNCCTVVVFIEQLPLTQAYFLKGQLIFFTVGGSGDALSVIIQVNGEFQ